MTHNRLEANSHRFCNKGLILLCKGHHSIFKARVERERPFSSSTHSLDLCPKGTPEICPFCPLCIFI